jgi:hypothetical protein
MDKSASSPVLNDEDYHLPCHGVGDTGHAGRVQFGAFLKDKGEYSSRLSQIIRQASKVPGPGKYVAHEDWKAADGFAFAKLARTYKPMNKTPPPDHYERKDIGAPMAHSIGSKDCTSNHPRIIHGRVPKGKRRSFLDQAINHGKETPDPGHYAANLPRFCDRLDNHVSGAMDWQRQSQKTKGMGKKVEDLAPNHYRPEWRQTEAVDPNYTVPKETGKNFLDKAVKEKWLDSRTKKEMPGPGTYPMQNFDDSKIARGTRHLQMRGLMRSATCGYL